MFDTGRRTLGGLVNTCTYCQGAGCRVRDVVKAVALGPSQGGDGEITTAREVGVCLFCEGSGIIQPRPRS